MKRSHLSTLVACAGLLLAIFLSATAVQAAPPHQGDGGPGRPYWLLLDPSRPVEDTLPPLLKALGRLKTAGVVSDFDQTPQDGALRATAGPGAAVRLRHLPGVVGLRVTPSTSAPARSGEAPPGQVGALGDGSITGVVTAAGSGARLSGIEVCAESDSQYECDTTNSNGIYTIGGLDTDSYRVDFYDDSATYVYQYYHNKPDWYSADLVAVTDGAVTSNINATLYRGGHITGIVTAAGSGARLADIDVYADSDAWGGYALTDENGAYDIGGLGTGSYRVDFYDSSDTYIEEYYNDKPTWETANLVAVTAGSTTRNINAALSLPGHITGVVTLEGSGAPLPDISVCAETDDGQRWGGCAETDGAGLYDIDGLGSGGYTVHFVDYNDVYASEYYNNRPDADTANLVPVTAGKTTKAINAALIVRGAIAGVVTAESGGALLGGIEVCAHSNDPDDWYDDAPCATTGGDGVYSIGGLDSGGYRVSFRDASATYVEEYYDDSPSSDASNSIAMTGGITVSGINAALARPAHITGTVTAEEGGAPLAGIHVCATRGVRDYEQWYCVDTVSGGAYDIGDLPGGVYRVAFYGDDVYATEYYDDRPARDEGNWVTVTAESSTPDINAALSAAGHITGVVTAAGSGEPLAGIEVCADNDMGGGCASTDSGGAYDIGGLGAGSYKVRFSDVDEYGWWGDYARQYYNGKSWQAADPVVVTAGNTTPDINAALPLGGHITGEVVGEDYWPLDDVYVCAYDGVSPGGYCTTTFFGFYDIGGLPTGTYYVEFDGGYYGGECYDDTSCDTPDWIAVTAGSSVDGIDAQLAEGGRITGYVTAEGSGAPLTGIEVCAGGWICNITDGDGMYLLDYDLGAHNYKVEFTDPSGVYAGEFYNNKPSSSSADSVAVVGGRTTRAINAALSAGGYITGVVTAEGSGAPLLNIKVTVYRSNGAGWDQAGVTYTDSAGQYDITLPSGTYRVKFEDWWWNDYLGRYYLGSISLTAPNTVPNIDAALSLPSAWNYLPLIRR